MKATHKDWVLFNGRIVNTEGRTADDSIRGERLSIW